MTLLDVCEAIVDCPHSTAKDEGKGYPLIRTPNVGKGRLKLEGVHRVSADVYNKRNVRAVPQENDLILAREAPVGNVAIIKQGQKVCLGQRTVLIRPNQGLVDPCFLTYYLLSPQKQHALLSASNGATVSHLNMSAIRTLNVELPEMKIQLKIGRVLSELDDKIETNNCINENLLQQARALFRQWFSVTSSGLYKLSDIADINPETYSPKENWSFVNYLDTSNITSGTINEVQYIIPSEEKLPSRARRILRKDDVVFSTVRPNQLHYGIISNPKPNMLGSTGFAVIRSKYETMPNEIIYLALTESAFVEQMQQLAEQSVSTFPSIRPADLDACVLPEPKEDDNDFMETIKTIFNAVATNNEENQRLATLRDTLLPRLMSGELDVSSLDF